MLMLPLADNAGDHPVIAGFIAAALLIIGSFATFIFTTVSDKRKARRESSQRWHGDLVEIAGAYFTAIREVFRKAKSIEKLLETQPSSEREQTIATYRVDIDRLLDEAFASYGLILIVAPRTVTPRMSDAMDATVALAEIAKRDRGIFNARASALETHYAALNALRYAIGIDDSLRMVEPVERRPD